MFSMGCVIIPKTYVANLDAPLIFLAGPIGSAPNWQDKALEIILSEDSEVIIASPRRGVRENLQKYLLSGDDNYFPRQRAWERHYLDAAGLPESESSGAVLFWLPGEAEHNCQKVYGAMTRIELGQWMTNYRHDKRVRFCVGSDGNFPELRTIAYDLQLDAPDKDVKKTLEETCLEALRIASKSRASPQISPSQTSFQRGEKVFYLLKNKVYDFGYMGQEGHAIIYEEGECNMQDAHAVDVRQLRRVTNDDSE